MYLEAVFHGDVTGGEVDEEFGDEEWGDLFRTLEVFGSSVEDRESGMGADGHLCQRIGMCCRSLRSSQYQNQGICPARQIRLGFCCSMGVGIQTVVSCSSSVLGCQLASSRASRAATLVYCMNLDMRLSSWEFFQYFLISQRSVHSVRTSLAIHSLALQAPSSFLPSGTSPATWHCCCENASPLPFSEIIPQWPSRRRFHDRCTPIREVLAV